MGSEKPWGNDNTPSWQPPRTATPPDATSGRAGVRAGGDRAGLPPREVCTPASSFASSSPHLPQPSCSFTWDLLDSFDSGSFYLIQTCCSDAFNLLALDPKLVPSPHLCIFIQPCLNSDSPHCQWPWIRSVINTHTFYENNSVLKINSKIIFILQTSWHERAALTAGHHYSYHSNISNFYTCFLYVSSPHNSCCSFNTTAISVN